MAITNSYHAIGLMSGSSLDGLDIAYCHFDIKNDQIKWEILEAETLAYDEKWQLRLSELPNQSALHFAKTHTYYGHYTGELVNQFLTKHNIDPDFIASHGHTIYHYPNKLFTCQIGDGAAIAAKTGLPVICDFRSHDVALEGEGTPLAPTIDKYLFPEYRFLLNLGGIANITYQLKGEQIAFDITPCNQVLNSLSELLGLEYDHNGENAAKGELIVPLYNFLNQYPFYKREHPKSLDNQDIKTKYLAKVLSYEASIQDKLHTGCKVFGHQIAQSILALQPNEDDKLLITGGGAYNSFLLQCLSDELKEKLIIVKPSNQIIEYKEALLMALLGVLRVENKENCFAQITKAQSNSIGGAIYQGIKKHI